MKVSQQLFEHVETLWEGYYEHPFVKGIGDGTLEKDKFQFYMIQDYLYLLDYAKVFALGIVKAQEEKHMRMFADLVYATLNMEMSTHKAYMKRLGITEADVQQAKSSLVTESYTKYMLALGFNEGMAEIATAVLACSWSYQCIGQHLAKNENSKEHEFYGEWICSYASVEFAKGNEMIIQLVDALTVNYSEQQILRLKEIIMNCSRYEAQFWEMSWNKEM